MFEPVVFLSWSSFIADSASFTAVSETKIVFSFGSLRVFLKEKDVEIIRASIFTVIVLKNELNSQVILKLFVSILLFMCKLLGCGLFVDFVFTNSFIPCHILRPFFCVFFKEFFKVGVFAFSWRRITLRYFLNLLWRSDFDLLSLAQQNVLCHVFFILIDLSIPFVIQS